MKLFPALPADLAAATDEDLAALHSAHVEAMSKIKANDTEFLGELAASEILAQLTAGRAQLDQLKAEQTARVEAQENFAAEVAKLTADIDDVTAEAETPEDGDAGTEDADEADAAADADVVSEAELVTAEAAAEETGPVEDVVEPVAELVAAAPRFSRPPATAKRHQPQPAKPQGAALVASAGLEKVVAAGEALNRETLALAMQEAYRKTTALPGSADVVVASARYDFPDDRTLTLADANHAGEITIDSPKVKAVVGEEALVASGGLCAPVTPYYQLMNIATASRPVRDALPSFAAVRGGLRFAAPPSIGDITTAVGKITAAQDQAGGSTGTKTCQTVICPAFSEVDVAAIYHCITAGNLGARAFPEQIAQFIDLVLAAHARAAETALLDSLKAGSTQVTTAEIAGATASLFPAMLAAAAQIRSFYRMADDAMLRVILPTWCDDLIKADIVRQPYDKFGMSDAEFEAILASFNLNVSYYLDGATGDGQVLGVQNAGAINGFPSTVKWFIFPEGTWLHLDGGTLELGLVRDSTLNATNSYQIFGEIWENVAKVGPVSYEVTSTLHDTGALSAPITIATPTAY